MNTNKYSWQIINGFYLKIIAFILMTVDHVGVFMEMYNFPIQVTTPLRIIGRFAFPLFIFMLVEGVRHTKHYGKYALRLGIIAALVLITQIIILNVSGFDNVNNAFSPLIDLLACSCVIYLLKRNDKFSWLVILPLTFIIGSFAVEVFEISNNVTVYWFPWFLRAGYSIFGLTLSLAFFYAKPLSKILLNSNESTKCFVETKIDRNLINIISAFSIFVISVLLYILAKNVPACDLFQSEIIVYSSIAGIIIMFYNGERGYNKPWFQYGSYLYFPLHIAIIYLIFLIIMK